MNKFLILVSLATGTAAAIVINKQIEKRIEERERDMDRLIKLFLDDVNSRPPRVIYL